MLCFWGGYSAYEQDGIGLVVADQDQYFKLTETGREALADMNSHWDQIIESIETISQGY